jgi:hypothetical protein
LEVCGDEEALNKGVGFFNELGAPGAGSALK